MRIDVQIPSLEIGGAESMCIELVNGLAEHGCRVRLFTHADARPGDLSPSLAPGVTRTSFGRAPYSLTVARLGARLHRPSQCDVVIYHLTPTLLTLAAQRLGGSAVPAVFVEHGPRLDRRSVARDLSADLLYAQANAIVCVSEAISDRYVTRVAPRILERTTVIPNGVHVDRIVAAVGAFDRASARRSLGLPLHGTMAGIVGRLVPVKGHDAFLTAWHAMRRAIGGVTPWPHLAIVGDGPLRAELERSVERLGMGDVVHFLGAVIPVTRALAALDVMVLPSLSEGLPMAVLEAMAAGVPIAANDVGGVGALLDGVGSVVEAGNHELLAAAVHSMLQQSATERAVTGARARDRVRARFDVSRMIDRYLELCLRLHRPAR